MGSEGFRILTVWPYWKKSYRNGDLFLRNGFEVRGGEMASGNISIIIINIFFPPARKSEGNMKNMEIRRNTAPLRSVDPGGVRTRTITQLGFSEPELHAVVHSVVTNAVFGTCCNSCIIIFAF